MPRVGIPHSYGSHLAVLYERGLMRPAIHIAKKTSAAPVSTAVTASRALFVIPKMFNSNIFNCLILANLNGSYDASGQGAPTKVSAKVKIFILKKHFSRIFLLEPIAPKLVGRFNWQLQN